MIKLIYSIKMDIIISLQQNCYIFYKYIFYFQACSYYLMHEIVNLLEIKQTNFMAQSL